MFNDLKGFDMETDTQDHRLRELLERAVALGREQGALQQGHTHADSKWPPLSAVNSPTVGTEQAAYYLGRKGQTLREWACFDRGPVRPLRVNGRLQWPVPRIREVMGVPA